MYRKDKHTMKPWKPKDRKHSPYTGKGTASDVENIIVHTVHE